MALTIASNNAIRIAHRAMISPISNIFNLTHSFDANALHAQFRQIATVAHAGSIDLRGRPVHIHDDAWIAAGVIVADIPSRVIQTLRAAESVQTLA